jgi:predicted permease
MLNLRILWARVKAQGAQRQEDDVFDEEIREHIAMLEERYIARGMSEQEAERAARLQFGNVTGLKERQRALRGFLSPSEWWQDVRFGFRMLVKRPVSNAAVVMALALGIGMNAAVFTFVNALLLRPPQGVSETNKLIGVWLHNPKNSGVMGYLPFDYPDYAYYRDHAKSLEGIAAFAEAGREAIWNHDGIGEILHGQLISGNGFSLLGVKAVAGRTLSIDDDRMGNPRQVMVLSYPFWKQKLGGDASAIGKTLMLNGDGFTVVGVAPKEFSGIVVGMQPDFWVPITVQERFTHDKAMLSDWDSYSLILAGRMRQGVGRRNVQAEMHVLAQQAYLLRKNKNDALDATIYPLTLVPGPYRGYVGALTGGLLAVFSLVLLIACTNAASLLLARATGRAREMATRSALGAGRAQLVRQMLVESLMLAGIAGGAGVAIASVTARLLMGLKPANIPIALETPMDWRVALFTVAVSVATGVVFGLAPALRASAVEAARVLKEEMQAGGRKKTRMRSALVVAQMAMCVVLLAGAALCVRSLLNANAIDAGFDTHHIAVASLDPASLGYSPAKINDFYTRLKERVKQLPGVSSASYVQFLPLGTARSETSVSKQLGMDPNPTMVGVYRVESGFFRTMGIPLIRGRDLTEKEAESEKPEAVVINETLARRLWPGEEAIGKHLAMRDDEAMTEVVGVVKDGKYHTLGEAPVPVVFCGELPAARILVVRTGGDDRLLLDEIRRAVPIVDPLMAATEVQTIEQHMALPLFPARTVGWLLGVSGVLAVVMTTIGLFGVIAYVVSQRRHEIGLCAAFGAARLLSPLLYGIGANDPATMGAVVIGLSAVALLACYLPARRATRVEPSIALRYE